MNLAAPAARAPIVAITKDGMTSGLMTSPFQRVMQALCDDANRVVAEGAVEAGSAFTVDRIASGRSLIRINFDLVPSNDAVDLYLLGRTGSGTDVTANSWAWPYNNAAATAAADTDTSDPQIILAKSVQSDASSGGVHGEITISNIQSDRYKRVGGWVTHFDGSRERHVGIAGRIDTALPLTGFKLVFSAGTVASGYARVEAP